MDARKQTPATNLLDAAVQSKQGSGQKLRGVLGLVPKAKPQSGHTMEQLANKLHPLKK